MQRKAAYMFACLLASVVLAAPSLGYADEVALPAVQPLLPAIALEDASVSVADAVPETNEVSPAIDDAGQAPTQLISDVAPVETDTEALTADTAADGSASASTTSAGATLAGTTSADAVASDTATSVAVVLEATSSRVSSSDDTNRSMFVLRDEAGEILQVKPVPLGQDVPVVFFDPLTFEAPGQYHFTISEVAQSVAAALAEQGSVALDSILEDAHNATESGRDEAVSVVVSLDGETNKLVAQVHTEDEGSVLGSESLVPPAETTAETSDTISASTSDAAAPTAEASATTEPPAPEEEDTSASVADITTEADKSSSSQKEDDGAVAVSSDNTSEAATSTTLVPVSEATPTPASSKVVTSSTSTPAQSARAIITKTYDTLGGPTGIFAGLMMVSLVVLAYSLQRCRTDKD